MDYRQISIRVPNDLMEMIERLAKKRRCSLNQLIVDLLPEGLKLTQAKEDFAELKKEEFERFLNNRLANDDEFIINQQNGSG